MWLLNNWYSGAENADVGGFAQTWYELCQYLGEWRDPSFLTLLLPVFIIPIFTLMFPAKNSAVDTQMSATFYKDLGRIQRNLDWV